MEEFIKDLSQLNPNSLFLNPPEIKLFSGYTLDLLRSKCLHINSTKIFQLQKFVSKRSTGKIHEVSEKRTGFHQLLKSIRTCNARISQRSISTYRDWALVLENLLKDILAQAKVAIHRSGMTEKIQWFYNAIMGQMKSLKGILNGTESMIPVGSCQTIPFYSYKNSCQVSIFLGRPDREIRCEFGGSSSCTKKCQ